MANEAGGRRNLGWFLLVAGLAMALVGLALQYGLGEGRTEPRAPLPTPVPTAAPPATRLALDPLPWAHVRALKDGLSGEEIPLTETVTPCLLELPAGTYLIELEHPELGARTLEIQLPAGQTTTFQEPLTPEFDPAGTAREEIP